MKQPLDGAVVLVTGGTGSLGQSLVRRLLRLEIGAPSKIIVFSRDEAKQYAMKTAWKHAHAATDDIYYSNFEELLEFWIGDVRDAESVRRAVSISDVVIHAAAMKQVPTCEYFPSQAVATNVQGAHNLVDAARRNERVAPDRHLHRQGVQADQRHGDDEGGAGADRQPRGTCTRSTAAWPPSGTGTCSRHAARSSRCSSIRSRAAGRSRSRCRR